MIFKIYGAGKRSYQKIRERKEGSDEWFNGKTKWDRGAVAVVCGSALLASGGYIGYKAYVDETIPPARERPKAAAIAEPAVENALQASKTQLDQVRPGVSVSGLFATRLCVAMPSPKRPDQTRITARPLVIDVPGQGQYLAGSGWKEHTSAQYDLTAVSEIGMVAGPSLAKAGTEYAAVEIAGDGLVVPPAYRSPNVVSIDESGKATNLPQPSTNPADAEGFTAPAAAQIMEHLVLVPDGKRMELATINQDKRITPLAVTRDIAVPMTVMVSQPSTLHDICDDLARELGKI